MSTATATRKERPYRYSHLMESNLKTPRPDVWLVGDEQTADYFNMFGIEATAPRQGKTWVETDLAVLHGRKLVVCAEKPADADFLRSALAGKCAVFHLDTAKLVREGQSLIDYLRSLKTSFTDDANDEEKVKAYLENLPHAFKLEPSPVPSPETPGEMAHADGLKVFTIDKVILDYHQLLTAEIPERRKIIEWLSEGSLAMVYAPRGLGKTFFGLSLAASIVSGKPFMRWPVVEPCGVLYIDGEMPLADFLERISGFMASRPEPPLMTLSHEIFYQVAERDLNITDEKTQKVILSYLDDNPAIRVLIVDNLSALTRIREDKGDDWRESFLPFILQCRRRRVAVLLVHHAGKNGDQRGTGAREDHLDISIRLSKVDDERNEGAYFRVDFTKARGVYGDAVKPFTAKLEKDPAGLFNWTLKDVEEDTETRLVKLIEETGGITVTDAAEELDLSKGTISKVKKRLIEKGRLKTTQTGAHALMKLSEGL